MVKLKELLVEILGQVLRIYALKTAEGRDLVDLLIPNKNIGVLGLVKYNIAMKWVET